MAQQGNQGIPNPFRKSRPFVFATGLAIHCGDELWIIVKSPDEVAKELHQSLACNNCLLGPVSASLRFQSPANHIRGHCVKAALRVSAHNASNAFHHGCGPIQHVTTARATIDLGLGPQETRSEVVVFTLQHGLYLTIVRANRLPL